jgi:hypothetical protein
MAGNPTSTRPKITSSSFGLSTAGERLGGKYKTIKISSPEKATSNSLNNINKTLDSILNTLSGLNKQSLRESELSRRESEKKKRQSREQGLESKTFDGIKKALSVITKPFESIFDKIWNFLYYTILGKIGIKLIDWFADPKNQGKVKSLIRFVTDWWPALLGGYILFGTTFGRLIRSTTGMVGRFIFQIGRVAIPQLLRFISSNPLIAAGAVTGLAAGGAEMWRQGEEEKQIQKEAKKRNLKPQDVKSEVEKSKASPFALFGQGMSAGFSGGGFATSGLIRGPKGVDKVPAMLTDGEFVMSAGAVQKYGVDTLESMNAAGGGTNQPKIINGATYAYGGGSIGGGSEKPYSGLPGEDSVAKLRKDFNNFFKNNGAGPNFDIGNPRTWGGGGGFNIPNIPGLPSAGGSGFRLPGLPRGGNIPGLPSGLGRDFNRGKKYLKDTYNQIINDPRVKEGAAAARQVYNKGAQFVEGIKKKGIEKGYLNEKGQLSGAAKNQATNFLSDLLPNLPGVNQLNKKLTENYLKNIGLTRENAKYGDMSSQALLTGKSGIDSAYNIGQLQLNKMSKESKQIYMKILKEKMASGTLKSGDVINPYSKVNKSDPRYREQGSVRFYVDPKTGKGYLLDTYGFDPGKVDLGGPGSAADKQYKEQLKTFQDPNKKIKLGPLDIPIGKIAKKLDLRPMQDATEGGGLPQYILALRNKIFGYDPRKEGSKLDPKRFKTKAQIDELKELGDLKKFAAKQLTPQQKKLIDEKLKKEKREEEKKKFEKKNPGAILYNKPQKNTGQSYKSNFSRPRNAGVPPVKPPVKPAPKVVRVSKPIGTGGGGISKGSNSQKAPSPSPRHPKGTGTTQRTTGTKR